MRPNESPDAELLRLRGEMGLMRRQLAETSNRLAMVQRKPKLAELEQLKRELAQYYRTHQTNFWRTESVQVHLISLKKDANATVDELANAREQVASIQRRLADGADFYTAARHYSQDSQAKNGGDWGWIEKGMLRKELEDVVFSLKEGQISPVMEVPDNFYIARILARREAQYKPLSDAYPEVLERVTDERRSADAATQE